MPNCVFCRPAPHPPVGPQTELAVIDPSRIPLGEDYIDHAVDVPVCTEHYDAFREYQRGETGHE